ncbi:MAG: LptF/LptG family permease [Parachlamydiaceae bacterium]|nr:LptF/LptG family permease [Parachlamydiaceae bacterium]
MPTLWRYLLSHFFKVTFFCVLAFVAILITMQLDEIAHFAALGAPVYYILLFSFYQIPYILPIAIPISCLIAAFIITQRLSSTRELTALRASGFSLNDIMAPLLLSAAFLSVFNFWMVSEVATQSHLTTNLLKSELRSINPLLLLNNKHMMRLKGIYFDALGPTRVGESASEVILAIPNTNQQRLNLIIAQKFKAAPSLFVGHNVTLITTMDSKQEDQFDHLLIENMEKLVSSTDDFSKILQKKVWTVNNDYLKMSFLLVRMSDQRAALKQARLQNDSTQIKTLSGQLHRSYAEITRRISIALSVLSFTFMGIAFGINISRQKKTSHLFYAIFLTVFYLITFFVAKGADQNWPLAASLYTIPLFIIILTSMFALNRATRGIE